MTYDVIVIGAGAGGEAAAGEAAGLGARTAVVERDLVGGECGFWACLPSKTLLNSAMQRWIGADYPFDRASARRDWMISREGIPYPDDSGHVSGLESSGVDLIRGVARIVGPGKVEVSSDGEQPRTLEGRNLVVSTGAEPVIPPIDGLADVGYWTSRDATALRELPSSIVVLGGGPVGVEMSQVYARFGVKTTLVEGNDRVLHRDHPRSSEVLAAQLREEGVEVRTGVHATAVRAGGAGRVVELDDGSSAEGAELVVAVGRRPRDLRAIGVEEAGARLTDRGVADPDDRMSIGDGLYVAGDAAGGLQFTHVADYEGRVAARAAAGRDARADLASVPKTTYTDPETASVGMTVEEAQKAGVDAFEVDEDFATSARGFSIEPSRRSDSAILEGAPGHITAVVDRGRGVLVGAFAACPGASDLIHEAVLAIKAKVPVAILADTIHAFPSGSRVFGTVVDNAAKQLT